MSKGRLEAFSDGVIAILITIMVLDLRIPARPHLEALGPLLPLLLSYALSFVFLGIYWSNHHHMLQAVNHVDGGVLWANLHLLFWLSLVPFVTAWAGAQPQAWPVACYGVVLICAAVAYWILARRLVALQGPNSLLAAALGRDFKGRISIVIYAAAIPLAFWRVAAAIALYVLVAVMWLSPDPRIERKMAE